MSRVPSCRRRCKTSFRALVTIDLLLGSEMLEEVLRTLPLLGAFRILDEQKTYCLGVGFMRNARRIRYTVLHRHT